MPRLKPIIASSNTAARFALFWLLMVAVHVAHAQRQAENWYFGNHAGLNFASGSPVLLTNSAMNTGEGCSTISDANGNLLFYSDGSTVWNKHHLAMENGTGLLGHTSSTQSCIAIPKPGSTHLYYLFTAPQYMENVNRGVYYSLIDMNMMAGDGAVILTEKNIMLTDSSTERITAVKHANNTDIWVIAHQRANNQFYAWLVTSAGISSPVISSVGVLHSAPTDYCGSMKASPDGSRIACTIIGVQLTQVFYFNTSTGQLSNPITLPSLTPYGVEFSPNSKLLYVSHEIVPGQIFQYNLEAGDETTIFNSRVLIVQAVSLYYFGALQVAVDGVLYIARSSAYYIDAIQQPDVLGLGCTYIANAVGLGTFQSMFGLPTFIQSYFNPIPFTYTQTCFGDTTEFIPEQTTGIDSVLWNFGNPASVPNDTSSLFSPVHVFTAPGTFSVSLTSWAGGVSATETQDVKINPLPQPFLGADTTLCGGNALILDAGEGYTAYLWNDGTTGKNLIVTTNGTYTVTVADGNGCEGSDGIHVEFHEVPGPVLIKHN